MSLDAEGFLSWTSKHLPSEATMISQCLRLENQALGGGVDGSQLSRADDILSIGGLEKLQNGI